MARVVCDKCIKGYLEETGQIKRIHDLDVCYVCGGYEPVAITEDELVVETTCEGYTPVEEVVTEEI